MTAKPPIIQPMNEIYVPIMIDLYIPVFILASRPKKYEKYQTVFNINDNFIITLFTTGMCIYNINRQ